jgi:hypothetical protein
MTNGYNKQLGITDSKRSKLIAASVGVESDGVGTALTLGRTARKLGVDTANKSQEDVFKDIELAYRLDQDKKSSQNLIVNLQPAPIERKNIVKRDAARNFTPEFKSESGSSSSYQFFVWKDGAAGRMTVPVDFGFKTI